MYLTKYMKNDLFIVIYSILNLFILLKEDCLGILSFFSHFFCLHAYELNVKHEFRNDQIQLKCLKHLCIAGNNNKSQGHRVRSKSVTAMPLPLFG